MLDQNTDRMWYVIGAVLIGAAIIFGMNTLMPNAFASVGGMFEDVIDEISWSTLNRGEVYTNPMGISYKETYYLNISPLDISRFPDLNEGDVVDGYRFNKTGRFHIITDFIEVRQGNDYELTSDNGLSHTRYSFYNSKYEFIDGKYINNVDNYIINAPDEAVYLRVSTDIQWNDEIEARQRTHLDSFNITVLD